MRYLRDFFMFVPKDQAAPHTTCRALEWFSAVVMLAWGLVLALPGETLAGPSYIAFQRWGITEDWWSAVFSAIGAARIAALYINGRWPKGPYIRIIGSLFGAVSWIQVSSLLVEPYLTGASAALSTGIAVYGPLAFAEIVSIFRAGFDARYYHR